MSFLFPAGLALSALAVPLIALYLLRLRRRKVRVPSLLPWHALRKSEQLSSPLHRLRRNLLLLVQLLLLALLVLAFARPYLETDLAGFRSLVLVIDATASMGATDVAPSRLERATQEARALVGDLAEADEVMVVVAGAQTRVASPFTRDHGVALRAIDAIAPTDTPGTLDEGLELALSLARSRPDVDVVVLSDGGSRDLRVAPPEGVDLRFLRVGAEESNAGIVAVDLRRSPVSELDRQLFVTLRGYGRAAIDAALEVYLDGQLLALRNQRLEPEVPVSLVFDLPSDATGVLRLALDADPDHLAADDEAFAVLAPLGSRSVLLVGGDALLARILASDNRVRADQVPVSGVTRALLSGYDAILFAGAVPDGVDGLDYAVLGPWPGSPVKLGDRVEGPRITGWQRTHPVLRYTRWDDVLIGATRPVVDPAGLATIVDGEHGPLVLAGQRDGGRVVQLAFDPLESDLPLRVGWPILVMNTVGWLTADSTAAESSAIRTGEALVRRVSDADAAAAPVLTGPAGEVSVSDGTLRVSGVDRVGTYEVRIGSTEIRFAANLLSEEESRIRPRDALAAEGSPRVVEASLAVSRRELWRPLLLGALIVLVLEWLLWNLRRVA